MDDDHEIRMVMVGRELAVLAGFLEHDNVADDAVIAKICLNHQWTGFLALLDQRGLQVRKTTATVQTPSGTMPLWAAVEPEEPTTPAPRLAEHHGMRGWR